jgi:hypothetical protein
LGWFQPHLPPRARRVVHGEVVRREVVHGEATFTRGGDLTVETPDGRLLTAARWTVVSSDGGPELTLVIAEGSLVSVTESDGTALLLRGWKQVDPD